MMFVLWRRKTGLRCGSESELHTSWGWLWA